MDETTLIAGYAAVVATGGAVVQFVSWRAGQTRVLVRMRPGTAPLLNGVEGDAIFVTVINRSDHAVKLMGLSFETADRRKFVVTHPFPTCQSFPYSIPARDQIVGSPVRLPIRGARVQRYAACFASVRAL